MMKVASSSLVVAESVPRGFKTSNPLVAKDEADWLFIKKCGYLILPARMDVLKSRERLFFNSTYIL